MIYVVAAIIQQDDKVLICKRAKGKDLALLWEFPGGKIESGESEFQAIIRECKEELNIIIEPIEVFGNATHDYSGTFINITFITASIIGGDLQNVEHEDIKWVKRNELKNYKFCPADVAVIENIIMS